MKPFSPTRALALLSISLAAAAPAVAQPAGPAASGPPSGWRSEIVGAYATQAEAELEDAPGEFGMNRTFVQISGINFLPEGNRVGIAVSYDRWDYDFAAGSAVSWDAVKAVSLSAPINWKLNADWRLFAVPTVSSHYESGGSLGDGLSGGAIVGATFQRSPRFSIGPGIGVFGKLEDGLSVFPILLIDWEFADDWSLETGRGLGATRGPGLFVSYKPEGPWQFQAGGRYESLDFRLADSNAFSEGAAEDRSVSAFLATRYAASRQFALILSLGYKMAGRLTIWNSDGDEVRELDYDNALAAGLSFEYRL